MKKTLFIKLINQNILFVALMIMSQLALSQQTTSEDSIIDFIPAIISSTIKNTTSPIDPPTSNFGNLRVSSQEITQFQSNITSATGTSQISWNQQGLLNRLAINFDFVDDLVGESSSSAITNYTYNAAGQINSLELNNTTTSNNTVILVSSTEQYTYNNNNRLVSFTGTLTSSIPNIPPGLLPVITTTTTINYSTAGQLIGGSTTESPTGIVTNYSITYDNEGRIATHTAISGGESTVQTFFYDISGTMSEITTTTNNEQRTVETFSPIINNALTYEVRIENLITNETELAAQGTYQYEQGVCRISQNDDGFAIRNAILTGRSNAEGLVDGLSCSTL